MKLLLISSLLCCHQLLVVVQSLAFSTNKANYSNKKVASPLTADDYDDVVVKSNRVFVAGISQTCSEETIHSTFSVFGTIADILIIGQDDAERKNKRKPYCFVTFDDLSSAQRAVASSSSSSVPSSPPSNDDNNNNSVYTQIQYSKPIDSRRRSNQSRVEEAGKQSQIEAYTTETNLIVQVQSTHVDRMVDYLHRWNDKEKGEQNYFCKVLGSASAISRNVSLLYLSCGNPIDLGRILGVDPLLARAINKSYIVQPGLLRGNLSTEQGCSDFAKMLFGKVSSQTNNGLNDANDEEEEPVVCRMQVFPPKYQSRLLQLVYDLVQEIDEESRQFTISPKRFTHMLSVVEAYQYKGKGWEERQHDDNSKLYMVGISPASMDLDVVDTNNIITGGSSGDDVSRAYYKLKEAIGMYEAIHGALPQDLHGSLALDCGSAPGGWTKYLIEHFGCKQVYSIDPGELSPSVMKLKETVHMQMKIQYALPKLLEDEAVASDGGGVKLWVSDMCLHNMAEQVELLLLAKEEGVLAPNAFFVLTLKCVVGHSKLAYDAQVKKVVDKFFMDANLDCVETFHLFSNRSGERTVIGYIK
eukprot:scaffold363_cov216-Skeletonema_marinoi.AAC.5